MAELNWWTALSGAIGALFGASGAVATSVITMKQQKKLEDLKWSRALEDENIKNRRDKIENRLKAYNRILKADGEIRVVFGDPNDPDDNERFSFKAYADHFRNVLYDDFHLLEAEVREIVYELDKKLDWHNFLKEIGEFDEQINHEQAIALYVRLIRQIRMYYRKVDH